MPEERIPGPREEDNMHGSVGARLQSRLCRQGGTAAREEEREGMGE